MNQQDKLFIATELSTHLKQSHNEMKEEEENKSIRHSQYIDEKEAQPLHFDKFVAVSIDNYIDCNKDLIHCPVVSRILHLLKYYKNIQSQINVTVSIHEYMTLLDNNYKISDVMEDWNHFKTIHLVNEKDIKYLEKCQQINCTNTKQCRYLNRYQRERARQIYDLNEYTDHKNIILMDQMDSIHSYIFHACSSRLKTVFKNKHFISATVLTDSDIDDDDDIKYEQKQYITYDIWQNKPESVSDCNVSQIVYIINHIIKNVKPLQPLIQEIIAYIKQNELNGNTLINMSRKDFMKDAAAHFGNKKLTIQFGKLYNLITKYDIMTLIKNNSDNDDIWYSNPQSISECSINQIIHILDCDIIDNCDNIILKSHKSNIIKFIKENKLNGQKIIDKRKEFIVQLKQYLNNNKLTVQISKLYKQIINYDLSLFVNIENKTDPISDVNQPQINNKFITSNTDINNYSFGVQYRYTPNLSYHPLYIKPKYASLKQELIEYFTTVNQQSDEIALLRQLSENVNSVNGNLESLFSEIIGTNTNKETKNAVSQQLKMLWIDSNNHWSDDDLLKIVYTESENCDIFNNFNSQIFHYLPEDFEFYSNCTLVALLDWDFNKAMPSFGKKRYYEAKISKKCSKLNSLCPTIEAWSNNEKFIHGTKRWHDLSIKKKMFELRKVFNTETISDLQMEELYNEVKSLFIKQATTMLFKAQEENKKSFIKRENHKRFTHYFEKSNYICSTNSVKMLKAVWYHGINKDHGIPLYGSISNDHVIALICYSNLSELCTAFRMTYRRENKNETQKQQNKRHETYGQMGKLLYESFVFFASTNSKLKILYHGMSIELLFSTMYCVFDAPTSTTTASSVATTFCGPKGIVVEFESSESIKYIRTLDMSLFSCFDHEEEHLIFETRLHIKDIWVPREKTFIGKKWMKMLSLYDLLTHGNVIYNKYLLQKKIKKNYIKY